MVTGEVGQCAAITLRASLSSKAILLLFRQPKRAIEIILPLPSLHQAFGLEPFEVGQVAQGGEAERLQEFPRRHIGERRAGLRRADRAVDQAMALEGAR